MKDRAFFVIAAAILIVSIILCTVLWQPSDKATVEVVQDGSVICSFDLNSTDERQFTVVYDGRENTILIEDGKICVTEADCPDQNCVHMGWLHSDSLPIVCLPNRLVIRYADSGQ